MQVYEVEAIKALAKQRNPTQAQRLLKRLADQIVPILTKHKFQVRHLQEFFPKDARLLGLNRNRGWKVFIRLRPSRKPDTFYPYEALLETLLHELTHNIHGQHNEAFYKYFAQLKEEAEDLMTRGLSGRSGALFMGSGRGYVLQPNSISAGDYRHKAALAADIRAKGLDGQPRKKPKLTLSQLRHKVYEAAEKRRLDGMQCVVIEDSSDTTSLTAWICSQCTFRNPKDNTYCEMCICPESRIASKRSNAQRTTSFDSENVIDLTSS